MNPTMSPTMSPTPMSPTLNSTMVNSTMRTTLNETMNSKMNTTMNSSMSTTVNSAISTAVISTNRKTLNSTMNTTMISTMSTTMHSTMNTTKSSTTMNTTVNSTMTTTLNSSMTSTVSSTMTTTLNSMDSKTVNSTMTGATTAMSSTSTTVVATTVSGTLNVTATAEGKEIMCLEDELAVDGLTWLALTTALAGSGVSMTDAVGPLTCSGSFDLEFTASFSESTDAVDFSSAVGETASTWVTEFENEAASLLNVTVSAELNQLSVLTFLVPELTTTHATADEDGAAPSAVSTTGVEFERIGEGFLWEESVARKPKMSNLLFMNIFLRTCAGLFVI
uniref:Uncharacterized protein n=1 Tax=Noctiluca scintillans TaxID=2966 RepID=A0A7S1FGI8_NOCSC|mmetsp:Transcript_62680/g.166329  ORF Transcript_62680/g.166329 Transcript_62680/m.166329 type:complete len:335 (+) Transcript_62680:2-1006(+)